MGSNTPRRKLPFLSTEQYRENQIVRPLHTTFSSPYFSAHVTGKDSLQPASRATFSEYRTNSEQSHSLTNGLPAWQKFVDPLLVHDFVRNCGTIDVAMRPSHSLPKIPRTVALDNTSNTPLTLYDSNNYNNHPLPPPLKADHSWNMVNHEYQAQQGKPPKIGRIGRSDGEDFITFGVSTEENALNGHLTDPIDSNNDNSNNNPNIGESPPKYYEGRRLINKPLINHMNNMSPYRSKSLRDRKKGFPNKADSLETSTRKGNGYSIIKTLGITGEQYPNPQTLYNQKSRLKTEFLQRDNSAQAAVDDSIDKSPIYKRGKKSLLHAYNSHPSIKTLADESASPVATPLSEDDQIDMFEYFKNYARPQPAITTALRTSPKSSQAPSTGTVFEDRLLDTAENFNGPLESPDLIHNRSSHLAVPSGVTGEIKKNSLDPSTSLLMRRLSQRSTMNPTLATGLDFQDDKLVGPASTNKKLSQILAATNRPRRLRDTNNNGSCDHNNAEDDRDSASITPPPIIRVRNFSLTPEGNVINRGDSFRVRRSSVTRPGALAMRKRAESLTPATMRKPLVSTRFFNGSVYPADNNLGIDADPDFVEAMLQHRRSVSNDPITLSKRLLNLRTNGGISLKQPGEDQIRLLPSNGDFRDQHLAGTINGCNQVALENQNFLNPSLTYNDLKLNVPDIAGEDILLIDKGLIEPEIPESSHYFVLVIGAENVGKSSILAQFMSSEYINAYEYSDDASEGNELDSALSNEASKDIIDGTNNVPDSTNRMPAPLPDIYENKELDMRKNEASARLDPISPSVATSPQNAHPHIKEKSISLTLDNESSLLTFIEVTIGDDQTFEDFYNYEDNGADGFLVVYSVNDRSTFERAIDVLFSLKRNLSVPKAKIMVGNKSDLVRAKEITTDEAVNVAKTYGCKFIETSAGLNLNLDNLLVGILTQVRIKNALALKYRAEEYNLGQGNTAGGGTVDGNGRECNSRISDVMMEDIMGTNYNFSTQPNTSQPQQTSYMGDHSANLQSLTGSPASASLKSKKKRLKKRLKHALSAVSGSSNSGNKTSNTISSNYNELIGNTSASSDPQITAQMLQHINLKEVEANLPAGIETDNSSTDLFKKRRSILAEGTRRASRILEKFVNTAKRHSLSSADFFTAQQPLSPKSCEDLYA